MGPLDNLPDKSGAGDPRAAEIALTSMTQELRNIQHNLLVQLAQDMARLQAEKSRLMDDIDKLQGQHHQLQARQLESVSQRQFAQQQLWSKQLAQVLASQLQQVLTQRLREMGLPERQPIVAGVVPDALPQTPPPTTYNDNAYRLLASLDTTLNTTFKTLQQELSSYQSSLSQQLSRMHSLQQQGEVILETLVDRLIEQLQEDATNVHTSAQIIAAERTAPALAGGTTTQPRDRTRTDNAAVAEPPSAPPPPQATRTQPPPPPPAPAPDSNVFRTGLLVVLLSSVIISFQNIVTKVILAKKTILGAFTLGGFIGYGAGNSLLILVMRMLLVVPLMAFIIAPKLYPNTWRDIKALGNPEKRNSVWIVVGSGLFLFLSQFFIYLALGLIPTGVATAIFFVFPTVTVLLAWLVFGTRPTFILALAVATIYMGVFLTIPAKNFEGGAAGDNFLPGAGAAIASGVTFAGYVILTQLSAKKLKLHPAPFSVINFAVILVLASVAVLFFQPTDWNKTKDLYLWGGTVILAATTLSGYVLNNFGIPMIGASLASVVSATGPALTSIMALVLISENLVLYQWLGVILVTLWVLGISVENMNSQKRATQAAK